MSCVEEDVQGTAMPTDEWKCLYSPKMAALQACNAFACPGWRAQDWSPVGPRRSTATEELVLLGEAR